MKTLYYAAGIASNGLRRVVWGVGTGHTAERAIENARADVKNWREFDSEPYRDTPFEYLNISKTQYQYLLAGDTSMEGL